MYGDDYLKSLIGKTVVGIDVDDGEHDLRFRCADGEAVVWTTEGDCCSESWWADGFALGQLRGATVTDTETLDPPGYDVEDERSRQEYDQAYGVEITTDRGKAQLVFRNSSNGYYGGWAGLGSDGGQNWREITGSDWQA